jgi:FkbM family methyltransferase
MEHNKWYQAFQQNGATLDQQVFIDYCKNASKIVDVGAQSGEFIYYANENMENGKIYSLEPDPNYIDEIKKIESKNGNEINIIETAAGSEKGTAKLYNESTGCMVDIAVKKFQKFVMVDVDTLDNLIPFEVDLIKVDVEAYEYEVLKGSKTHLERGTPFYVEIHDKWLREIGLSRFDIIELFKEYGYTEKFLWRPEHQINWADLYYYVFTKK